MNRMSSVLVCFALAGCGTQLPDLEFDWDDPQPLEEGFTHKSTLYAPTNGVAMDVAGDRGVAGMYSTTCAFNIAHSMGQVGQEYDMDGPDDELVDDDDDDDQGSGTVLIKSGGRFHHFEPGQGILSTFSVDNPVDGQLADGGIIALHGNAVDCAVEWIDTSEPGQVAVDPSLCTAHTSMDSDPYTGTTYLSTADGVVSVTQEGSDVIDSASDLVVWDPVTEMLYVTQRGTDEIRGLDASGVEIWAQTIEGSVYSIDHLGDMEGVAAMADMDDATGILVLLDGHTGELIDGFATPQGEADVKTYQNGRLFGFVRPDFVHFVERVQN